MNDIIKFFSDNEKRNLWFSAMAVGMTLAITIFALSCCICMVYGADGILGWPSDAVEWCVSRSGSSEEVAFGYPSVIFIKKPNGLCDVVAVGDRLEFYGVGFVDSDGQNTSGARQGSEFHPTWAEDGVTYRHLTDFVWYDNVTSFNQLVFDNEEYAIKALTDPSYEQYAMNYDDFEHYNSDICGLFNMYFSSASPTSATLTIEPTEAYAQSEYANVPLHLSISPACYCAYFYSSLGKGRLDPSKIYDFNQNLSEDLSIECLSLDKCNIVHGDGSSGLGSVMDYVVNDSVMASRNGFIYGGGDPLSQTVPKAWLTLWSKELEPIEFDWSGGTVNQSFNFDSSIVHNEIKLKAGPDFPNSHSLSAVTPCAYRAVCDVSLDGFKSTPVATYKWFDTSFFSGSPPATSMTTTSKLDDSGHVVQDTFQQYNDNGTIGVMSNDNIIQFINNGFGLTGQNGIIETMRKSLSFLPDEIWMMILAALGLSLILMIIKVLRGM